MKNNYLEQQKNSTEICGFTGTVCDISRFQQKRKASRVDSRPHQRLGHHQPYLKSTIKAKEHPGLHKITSIFYDGNSHISVLQPLSTQACPFPIWSFSTEGTVSIYSTDKNVLLYFQHNNINRSSKANRISVK
jgi:hypothetical protein